MDSFWAARRVNKGFFSPEEDAAGKIWAVGSLVRAVADVLAARFNPVAVKGELSGFSRAASGHCYFSLKDDAGQIRCAMFRRSADLLEFQPRDGQLVEARGKLDVYGPRGDLQLIVEHLQPLGQGNLFEQFLRIKAQLESEGLFDPARKRALPQHPASIAVVTSLGAAALRDVCTALRRRAPHLPVEVHPASVQGAQAPQELCRALEAAYARFRSTGEGEVLLLVRGGGSLEDLWAFNDPQVVRTLSRAPMPTVCGVGHETDFTLADFAADLRAPTPTAAAELCAPAREQRLAELNYLHERLAGCMADTVDRRAQRLDHVAQRIGRPSVRLHRCEQALSELEHRMRVSRTGTVRVAEGRAQALAERLPRAVARALDHQHRRLQTCEVSLAMLDPSAVLERGYAYLSNADGLTITRAADVHPGQRVIAHLADGALPLIADPD